MKGLGVMILAAAAVAALPVAIAEQVTATPGPPYAGVYPKPLFVTPQRAAYCSAFETSFEDFSPTLFCWTPNDGWAVSINWLGRRATARYYNKPPAIVHDIGIMRGYVPRAPLFRFGARWVYRCGNPNQVQTCHSYGYGVTTFRCSSASTGLTCRNARGHGFWIGRFRGYRLF